MSNRAYWYRHTNGTLHRKVEFVVEASGGPGEYFNSPFVAHWWYGTPEDEPGRPMPTTKPTPEADGE